MAYDKKKIYKQAEEEIKKNNLFFIEDIVAFVGCSKTYFYDAFPIDSNEMNALKDLLEQNKTKTKSAIRSKLYKGTKASELLALYRLICTNEERQSLNQSYVDHTSKGKQISAPDLSAISTEELKKIVDGK